jgi:hypothetical protein
MARLTEARNGKAFSTEHENRPVYTVLQGTFTFPTGSEGEQLH